MTVVIPTLSSNQLLTLQQFLERLWDVKSIPVTLVLKGLLEECPIYTLNTFQESGLSLLCPETQQVQGIPVKSCPSPWDPGERAHSQASALLLLLALKRAAVDYRLSTSLAFKANKILICLDGSFTWLIVFAKISLQK